MLETFTIVVSKGLRLAEKNRRIIINNSKMSIAKKACKTEIFIAIEYGDTEQVKRMLDAYPDLLHTKTSS